MPGGGSFFFRVGGAKGREEGMKEREGVGESERTNVLCPQCAASLLERCCKCTAYALMAFLLVPTAVNTRPREEPRRRSKGAGGGGRARGRPVASLPFSFSRYVYVLVSLYLSLFLFSP